MVFKRAPAPSSVGFTPTSDSSAKDGYKSLITFLKTQKKLASKNLNAFASNRSLSLPKTPHLPNRPKIFSDLTQEEKRIAHADTIAGGINCVGTGEVAKSVASAILGPSESYTIRDISKMKSSLLPLGISVDNLLKTEADLKIAHHHLYFLHEIRTLTDFFRQNFFLTQLTERFSWNSYTDNCSLIILDELKKNGQVLIPSDFFYLKNTNTSVVEGSTENFRGHATSIVIEKRGSSDEYAIHHFETNGYRAPQIPKSVIQKLRTITLNNGTKIQDRSKTFTAGELYGQATSEDYKTADLKPKSFLRKTIITSFPSLNGKPKPADLRNDLDKISTLLFLEQKYGLGTMKDMLDNQLNALESFDIFGDFQFEPQRLHAIQHTESCELKSTTAPLAYLLDNETSYQCVIGLYVLFAQAEIENIGGPAAEFIKKQLVKDLNDVTRRISDSLSAAEQLDITRQ